MTQTFPQDTCAEPCAFLIDGDHISPTIIGQALAFAELTRNVTIRRVYARWDGIPRSWRKVMAQYMICYQHEDPPARGYNAADITLVIDALKLFYREGIRSFVLVASDSDYTALVKELLRENCAILGIGAMHTSLALQNTYSTFVLIESLDRQES